MLSVFPGVRFKRKTAHSIENHGEIPARAGTGSRLPAEFGRLWEYTGTCVREAASAMQICDSPGGRANDDDDPSGCCDRKRRACWLRRARNTDFHLHIKGDSVRLNCTERQA
jgi:hypothetical protein